MSYRQNLCNFRQESDPHQPWSVADAFVPRNSMSIIETFRCGNVYGRWYSRVMKNGGVVNKERLWRRAAGALTIVGLVLVTNEGYRQVRALLDDVSLSKKEIASIKRELYVLQVQLDTRPAGSPALAVPNTAPEQVLRPAAAPAAVASLPMPPPIGPVLSLPETPARSRPKPQSSPVSNDEQKSLVSVVLMSDAKPASVSSGPGAKPHEEPRMDVKLVGDGK